MHHDSYMAFTDVLNALHAVFDAKRLISCKFTEATVQPEKEHWFFRVVSNGGKSKAQVLYGRRGSGACLLQRLAVPGDQGQGEEPRNSTCLGSLKRLLQPPSPMSWINGVLERATRSDLFVCLFFCFLA